MPGKVLDADDAKQMGALLASLHCGVLAMSFDVAGFSGSFEVANNSLARAVIRLC
jgi:hypothetical protein